MKSYQYKYDNSNRFEWQMRHVKSECELLGFKSIMFYITWVSDSVECLKDITDCIEKHFPNSLYYGNEASGNIYNGELVYGVVVTCYVFEDSDTRTKLLWVEKGTQLGSLSDLWNYCRAENGLRAVELLPSITYIDVLNMDNNTPDIDDDVLIFGGASLDYDNMNTEAGIMAKGHPVSKVGMVVILYFGEKLNIFFDHLLGWKGLGRYMKVTKSHDKIIEELDGEPAYSVYEKYLGISDNDTDNLVFPLIIEEDGVEFIRTPQKFLPDKSMSMFANIHEGLWARIAYGDKNTILSSLFEKVSDIADFKPQVIKAYSCTARRLFWGDDEAFRETKPLQQIAPINGFYSGGEILRFGSKLKVMNSTLVLIGFREGTGEDMETMNVTRIDRLDKSLLSRITHFVEVVSKEQKEALDRANEEKHRNEILHDIIHSGQWSFLFNEAGKIYKMDISPDAKRIANYDFTERVSSLTDAIHPDEKESIISAFDAAIADKTCNTPYDVSYRMADRNGEYHWFHAAGRVVRDENGGGEFFGILINITDQLTEQIKQQEQLQDALMMADIANRAKTEFLFSMSHDIRTPMNAILGFTNMAIRNVDNRERTLDWLHKIQQSGDLLLSLINNVLEVSRIESGNATLEEKCEDIYFSFVNIENTMQLMAHAKDISLTFEFGEIKDRYIICDFGKCLRIFVNIISNGIKYTREGGYVKVRCEQIESDREGYALFCYTFEDNGLGMSEEFQKHVYEQFTREHNTTATGIQGTGLGMAVCKSFVDLMGGTIECRSKLGEGTTFTVTLPFKLQGEEAFIDPVTNEVKNAIDPTDLRNSLEFRGNRVLLAEDNEINREIAVEILEEEGFTVKTAENGQIAVDIMRESGVDSFDYILMDIQMPVMDGYEATRKIRAMYPNTDIPIIALSANAFAEDKAASLESGMDDHVSKPINVKELLWCMSKHK